MPAAHTRDAARRLRRALAERPRPLSWVLSHYELRTLWWLSRHVTLLTYTRHGGRVVYLIAPERWGARWRRALAEDNYPQLSQIVFSRRRDSRICPFYALSPVPSPPFYPKEASSNV